MTGSGCGSLEPGDEAIARRTILTVSSVLLAADANAGQSRGAVRHEGWGKARVNGSSATTARVSPARGALLNRGRTSVTAARLIPAASVPSAKAGLATRSE